MKEIIFTLFLISIVILYVWSIFERRRLIQDKHEVQEAIKENKGWRREFNVYYT
jgi:heme exporter protein D